MDIIETKIPDVKVLVPRVFGDSRGFFKETWNRRELEKLGLDLSFVQDNFSRSCRNTLRGLHYQRERPQGKLVWVSLGEVLDVAVDIRPESATFGCWVSEVLSETNHRMMWVPPGFAHGFLVKSELADFQYKCTDFYAPEFERCIRWDDERLGIDWGGVAPGDLIISEKDARGRLFQDLFRPVIQRSDLER